MSSFVRAGKRVLRSTLGGVMRDLSRPQIDLPPSTWRLRSHPAEGLMLDGIALADVCASRGSPLHIVDARKLVENAAAFSDPPAGSERACKVFYSYKTNPVPRVLQLLHARGIGAEVTSDHELWVALRLGVDPARIVLNGTAKSVSSVREAVGREIALINLNGREEVDLLVQVARELGKRPKVGLRVLPENGWGAQLGERGEAAVQAFADALGRPELDVVAVHAHRGPEIATAAALRSYVESVLRFCDLLGRRLSFEPSVVDFGGSLCCPTVAPLTPRRIQLNRAFGSALPPPDPEARLGIRGYVKELVGMVERHFRDRGRPAPTLVIEPGRAMTANAQMLLATVLRIKENDGVPHAILNAGVNVAQPLQTEYHAIFPVLPRQGVRRRRYRLVGPISSPGDILCYSCELPELVAGDTLAIMDTGAYFVSFSTSFSFRQPGIVLIEDGKDTLVRRAETSEDLVARDVLKLDPL